MPFALQLEIPGSHAPNVRDVALALCIGNSDASAITSGCKDGSLKSQIDSIFDKRRIADSLPVWSGDAEYEDLLAEIHSITKDKTILDEPDWNVDRLSRLLQFIRLRPEHLQTTLQNCQPDAAQIARYILRESKKWGWGLQRASAVAVYCLMVDRECREHLTDVFGMVATIKETL